MARINVIFEVPEDAVRAGNRYAPSQGRIKEAQQYFHFLTSRILAGTAPGSMRVEVESVQGSATVTCASVQAADTVTINGVTLTAVASNPTSAQFAVGVDDTATAANLAAAINAQTSVVVSKQVTARSSGGVVTVLCLLPGDLGDNVALASSNGTRLAVAGVTAGRITSGATQAAALFSY